MLRYFLRRLLLAVPTLIIISMITFALNRSSPYDPVEEKLSGQALPENAGPETEIAQYRREALALGRDLPTFYLTLQPSIFPDTLYRVFPLDRRRRLCRLTVDCGDWTAVGRLEQALWQALAAARGLPAGTPHRIDMLQALDGVRSSASREELTRAMAAVVPLADSLGRYAAAWPAAAGALREQARTVIAGRGAGPLTPPSVHWYGTANAYHRWVTGVLLHGELGLSRRTYKPVWSELRPLLASTLVLNCTALVLAYLIAIPLGVWLARRAGRHSDRWAQWTLLMLYAVPVFWLGSVLMLVFASPAIFNPPPIPGAYIPAWRGSGLSLFGWVWRYADRFALPVATITLHTLASLALQMRGSMLGALGHDYIRTARAKGLPEKKVYWRHAFRNALFPLITSFASIFPAVFAGSLVVEFLFGFPGMGTRTQEAFVGNDEPILLAILMLSAVLTVAGMLIADLLYARADPRVKFRR